MPHDTIDSGGLALTLSGGGLRATLFHLGVLRRLAAAGKLGQVRAIFAVSGGSILAAHVRLNWDRYKDPAEFDKVAREVFDLCERDLRGRVVRRSALCTILLLPWILRLLARVPGLGSLRRGTAPVNFLIAEYERFYRGARLPAATPGAPTLHLLATSLNTGEICVCENDRFRIRRAHQKSVPAQRTGVAVGVAASSAYPALFRPLRMDADWLVVRKDYFPETHFLSDGGLHDNLGVVELMEYEKENGIRFDEVIVSDAGAAMSAEVGVTGWGLFRRGIRTTDILMNRMSEAALLLMEGDARFRKLSIHATVPGQPIDENTQSTIGSVRTDLDVFTRRERAMIANHGYLVAGMVLDPGATPDPASWLETAGGGPVDASPLEGSQSPSLWGLLNPRDWCSWAVLGVTLAWITVLLYGISYPSLLRSYRTYKNQTFIEQTRIAEELNRSRITDMNRFRMTEYWEQPGHEDLAPPLRLLKVHRLAGAHQRLCEAAGWLPGPFPRLERPEWNSARANGIVKYMHALGDAWSRELPEEFVKFRDAAYLDVMRITDSLAASDAFDEKLAEEFYSYYWGGMLPVESRYEKDETKSVEGAMFNFGSALDGWRNAGKLSKDSRTTITALRDELRRRILEEVKIGNRTAAALQ